VEQTCTDTRTTRTTTSNVCAVSKVRSAVDEDQYCIDILTQVSAATKALQSVALGLLEEHLGSCVVDAARAGGPEADIKVKEAADAIARLVRS
jgi:DNA-binding FrmR family transcriptional regulator